MQFQKIDDSYIVYVEKGEKVIDILTAFCIEQKIYSGQISGIGAVKNVDIGAYDITSKDYIHKIFDSTLELLSFQANIALKDVPIGKDESFNKEISKNGNIAKWKQ